MSAYENIYTQVQVWPGTPELGVEGDRIKREKGAVFAYLAGIFGNAQIGPMKKVAGRIKLELSQYRDLEAFAQFGSDLDADTQRTLARGERLVQTLNQNERAPLAVEDQTVQIYAATNGFLDRLNADRVGEFLTELTERMHSQHQDVREKIAGGDWSEETQKAVNSAVESFARDFGFDLDEEGQPMDDSAAPEVSTAAA